MYIHSRRGFSLVELLIAISISAIILVGMTQIVAVAVDTTERERHAVEALNLAEEGLEALRAMRNASWSSNIQPLANGVNYYPIVSGDNWSMTSVDPGLILGQYDRKILLTEVLRDASDNIGVSGAIDPNTRQITMTVGWRERSATTTVVLETYLTNFLGN